ncbi:hypothetical protein BN903_422 [Halorubrum sp. AJ67]|nr:hypothetical protein BN903_422 [Halorubrum sp. AJ67]
MRCGSTLRASGEGRRKKRTAGCHPSSETKIAVVTSALDRKQPAAIG